jgi:hypothetical protein
MRKQYFVLLLIGLIVAAGVMFTTCDSGPYNYLFQNVSDKEIKVMIDNADPAAFTLEAVLNDAAPATEQYVTSDKALRVKDVRWNISGMTQTESEREVIMEFGSASVIFKKNPDGMANIKQAK